MEEKKDNKGLLIGIIIFLIICLVAIFYFMFKMTYVENKDNTNNNTSESEQKETTNQEEGFTELTKYELQEGEEKEITIKNKTIKLKRKDDKIYLNDNEIGKSDGRNKYEIFVVDNLIFFPHSAGQFGDKYNIYDFDGKEVNINDKGGSDAHYNNIRLKNNKIYTDVAIFGECYDVNSPCYFFEMLDVTCSNEKYKDIKENIEEYEKHKNEEMNRTYEIKYDGKEVTIEKAEDINTIEKWIETY